MIIVCAKGLCERSVAIKLMVVVTLEVQTIMSRVVVEGNFRINRWLRLRLGLIQSQSASG